MLWPRVQPIARRCVLHLCTGRYSPDRTFILEYFGSAKRCGHAHCLVITITLLFALWELEHFCRATDTCPRSLFPVYCNPLSLRLGNIRRMPRRQMHASPFDDNTSVTIFANRHSNFIRACIWHYRSKTGIETYKIPPCEAPQAYWVTDWLNLGSATSQRAWVYTRSSWWGGYDPCDWSLTRESSSGDCGKPIREWVTPRRRRGHRRTISIPRRTVDMYGTRFSSFAYFFIRYFDRQPIEHTILDFCDFIENSVTIWSTSFSNEKWIC